MEKVILVDKDDNQVGIEEKIKAHKEGILHRALSVFVFNSKGEMLLQKRAAHKYHSAGLWSNACCSHPRPGEKTEDAAQRRIKEEMGFDCSLEEIFVFLYRKQFDNGLTEHELDHVFIGVSDDIIPKPSPDEVEDWKFMKVLELEEDIKNNPNDYTYWFKEILSRTVKAYEGLQ